MVTRREPLDVPSASRVSATSPVGRPVTIVVAIFLLSANLRTTVASLPPLLVEIEADLRLSGGLAGLLTSLPVLCMAVFAPAAHRLAHRFGREATALAAACAVGAGNGLRGFGAEAPALFGATLLAGLGVAVAGVVLPGLVKDLSHKRPGAATAAYSVAMMLGASLAAILAVPLRDLLGTWQASLAWWALPGLLAVAAWMPATRSPGGGRDTGSSVAGRLPWRSHAAWLLAAFFSAQSSLGNAFLGWLSPAYENRGWSPQAAGALLGALQLAQVVAALVLPVLSDRLQDPRSILMLAAGASVTGTGWLLVLPDNGTWVAVCVLGSGLGGGFTVGLVLLVRYAVDARASSGLTAMVFLVSYAVAASAPVVVGVLRDATGDFNVPFAVLLVVAFVQLGLVITLRPRHEGSVA